jgi:flavin-dependent dehydrogenase
MAVDPLSSSGIARGLETGEAAALAIKTYFRGDLGSLLQYEQRICADYGQYLQRRAAYHALETRWPASLFWQRRRVQ